LVYTQLPAVTAAAEVEDYDDDDDYNSDNVVTNFMRRK
jgi:hypothetical protein